MGMLYIGKYRRGFQDKKKRDGAKHRQNPKILQSASYQSLGEELTFQQDNNLQHKAKSTLELLTKKTVNVPEWPAETYPERLTAAIDSKGASPKY